IVLCAGAPSKGFSERPADPGTSQAEATLEILDFCTGWCGSKNKKVSIGVYPDKRAEYKVYTLYQGLGKEATFSTTDFRLDENEFAELMKLVETPDFISARSSYSGPSGIDSFRLTLIIYRGVNPKKIITLINNGSLDASNEVPASVKRILAIRG